MTRIHSWREAAPMEAKTDEDDAVQPISGDVVQRTVTPGMTPRNANHHAEMERRSDDTAPPTNYLGRTMFDGPASEDGSITVLVPRQCIGRAPSQALVRINTALEVTGEADRTYLGIVTAGPFAEPDGLRGDAPVVVTASVRGAVFQPNFHGRVQVELLGEEVDGVLQPPRYRPLPNSLVTVLDDDETARVLGAGGDLALGLAVGHDAVQVGVPSDRKGVLPRHTGIIGTTGGGKSTTVAGLVAQAQRAGMSVILLDVEGEYTRLREPTDDPVMIGLLGRMHPPQAPDGVPNTMLYHLASRAAANPESEHRQAFSLRFSDLSPYTVIDVLDLSEAQQERYWQTYEVAVELLQKLSPQRADTLELDDFETGYPGVTLEFLIDVAGAILSRLNKGETRVSHPLLCQRVSDLKQAVAQVTTSHPNSWRALLGRLSRLRRLGVFDDPRSGVHAFDAKSVLKPGQVSIIDLSDTDATDLKNLVIADILRGIQRAQEDVYAAFEDGNAEQPRTLVIVEEAHEFLAKDRISRMPNLFAQVERIAKRGRKRWLGLVFVTQLPQHLAPQVFALINNWVIHKVNDPAALSDLKHAVSGVDASLWRRVPGLAPGQAVVAFNHMTRPILTAIHPTPAKLRMVD